MLGIDEIIIG